MGKINKIRQVLNGLINYIKILPYQLQLDKYKTKLFDFFSRMQQFIILIECTCYRCVSC